MLQSIIHSDCTRGMERGGGKWGGGRWRTGKDELAVGTWTPDQGLVHVVRGTVANSGFVLWCVCCVECKRIVQTVDFR